ncbi:MAG: helicase [Sandaracinaceae bacterium]
MTKRELLAQLAAAGVELNDGARTLFASDAFVPAAAPYVIETTELSVSDIGLTNGATLPQLVARAAADGLVPCPLEVGPHLRLQLLDQPAAPVEDERRHRAPPGSITIVSESLSDQASFPKGFYLRRHGGALWLRGYWCDDAHVWDPQDRVLFARR